MSGLCQERSPGQDWRIADRRALSLGRIFAGVLAWDSSYRLRHGDQRRTSAIFREHAAPGAALMSTGGPGHGVGIGSYRGEPLDRASLDGAEYRALLEANGFGVVAHAVEDPACGGRTVWLARHG